jgi:hypothetical protein
MFRTLPSFGADPRGIAEVVRGIMNGKTNNTGLVTLGTGNVTTTTIYDERIGGDSKIVLVPFSEAAYEDSAPYGAFQDGTDQSVANTTTAYAITLDTTDFTNGVYLSNSSRINVRSYGIYNFQFSIQFKNTTNDGQDIDIWFRKNGTDIANSNSKFHIPARKSSGDPSYLIGALNFFAELQVNDYVQLMWRASDTAVTIEYLAAQTTPTRPATPSVILTVTYVAPAASTNVYVSSQTKGSATLTHYSNSTADKTYAYIIVG